MERFWSKVQKTETCWIWTASKDKHGYGQIGMSSRTYGTKRPHKAYRVAYELLVGPVPVGLEIDHLCRNPSCVNPDHLEAVSHKENMRRGRSGWNTRAKTHCPRGHDYSGPDGRVNKTAGSRYCCVCNRNRTRERRLQKKTQTSRNFSSSSKA